MTIFVHGSDVTVDVPSVTGLTVAAAQAALSAAGLGCDVPAGVSAGPVVSQTPAAGDKLEIGGLVQLTLGPGPSPTTSP